MKKTISYFRILISLISEPLITHQYLQDARRWNDRSLIISGTFQVRDPRLFILFTLYFVIQRGMHKFGQAVEPFVARSRCMDQKNPASSENGTQWHAWPEGPHCSVSIHLLFLCFIFAVCSRWQVVWPCALSAPLAWWSHSRALERNTSASSDCTAQKTTWRSCSGYERHQTAKIAQHVWDAIDVFPFRPWRCWQELSSSDHHSSQPSSDNCECEPFTKASSSSTTTSAI